MNDSYWLKEGRRLHEKLRTPISYGSCTEAAKKSGFSFTTINSNMKRVYSVRFSGKTTLSENLIQIMVEKNSFL